MHEFQHSIGREAAVECFDTDGWRNWTHEERAFFQLGTAELSMPFGKFQQAMETVLDRPVFTHEFADPSRLLDEWVSKKPATLSGVMEQLPADKAVVVL